MIHCYVTHFVWWRMNSPIGCHVKPLTHLDGNKFLPLCNRKIHVTKKGSVLIGDVVVSSIWYVIEMLCILESILATCFLTTDYPCKTNSIWKKMVEPAKRANPLFTLLEINHRVRFKIFGWTPLHKLIFNNFRSYLAQKFKFSAFFLKNSFNFRKFNFSIFTKWKWKWRIITVSSLSPFRHISCASTKWSSENHVHDHHHAS